MCNLLWVPLGCFSEGLGWSDLPGDCWALSREQWFILPCGLTIVWMTPHHGRSDRANDLDWYPGGAVKQWVSTCGNHGAGREGAVILVSLHSLQTSVSENLLPLLFSITWPSPHTQPQSWSPWVCLLAHFHAGSGEVGVPVSSPGAPASFSTEPYCCLWSTLGRKLILKGNWKLSLKGGDRRSEDSPVTPCFAVTEGSMGHCCHWSHGRWHCCCWGLGLSSIVCWTFPFAVVTSWTAFRLSCTTLVLASLVSTWYKLETSERRDP